MFHHVGAFFYGSFPGKTVIRYCVGILGFLCLWLLWGCFHKFYVASLECATRPINSISRTQTNVSQTKNEQSDSLYLHYISFNRSDGVTDFPFTSFLSVMSAVQYLSPAKIFVHGDYMPTGAYWKNLTDHNYAQHVPLERPTTGGGTRYQKLSPVKFIEHSADIAKLDILLKYGGVAVDFDVFFVCGNRIKEILKIKRSIACYYNNEGGNIGFVAGHPNSKFLWAWRRSYRDIYVPEWNFNQGFVPYYLMALYREEVFVLARVCDNNVHLFSHDYGKIDWRNSAAIHSYERLSSTSTKSPADLGGKRTSHKEMFSHIFHNRTLYCANYTLPDDIPALP